MLDTGRIAACAASTKKPEPSRWMRSRRTDPTAGNTGVRRTRGTLQQQGLLPDRCDPVDKFPFQVTLTDFDVDIRRRFQIQTIAGTPILDGDGHSRKTAAIHIISSAPWPMHGFRSCPWRISRPKSLTTGERIPVRRRVGYYITDSDANGSLRSTALPSAGHRIGY